MEYEKELNAALEAALKAKEVVLKYYYSGFNVEIKEDSSPVTDADKASDKIIRDYLGARFDYAFLTEESADSKERLNSDYVWIVDPIDGTENYVSKDGEFTINIGLAYKHKAVLGVVLLPAKNEIYYAVLNHGAYRIKDGITTKIHVNDKIEDLTVLCSKNHTNKKEEETIEKHKDRIKHIKKIGSSIKACYIASGLGEISYRMSQGTKEWDTCAFQIIVEEAGGLVLKPDKTPITYNRVDIYNREGYIIINRIENFLF